MLIGLPNILGILKNEFLVQVTKWDLAPENNMADSLTSVKYLTHGTQTEAQLRLESNRPKGH